MSSAAREPHELLREYARLNRDRKGPGVTPLEYQRWLDLRRQLERAFPNRPPPGPGGELRIRVEFKTGAQDADAVMWEIRPIGLFLNTPFAPEEGTHFTLLLRVEETSECHEARVVVVSNNVGPGYSTNDLGMGVRFTNAAPRLTARLEDLCRKAGRVRRRC